ncbi:Uncharacterised protein [Mycobacteroides abscessus subsp. abscessus]|nr:Uncharacterised protein [Mycobacteroides abscessus subsp. abscessus]
MSRPSPEPAMNGTTARTLNPWENQYKPPRPSCPKRCNAFGSYWPRFALKKPQILMATQDPAKELSTTVMPVTESIASVTTTPRYISTTAIPEAMSVV